MIFRIKSIYIYVSKYFFIMLIWLTLTRNFEAFILCFLALIIHEVGHIIAIYIMKERINIFYILPFGFCCRLINQTKINDRKMIKILLTGPVTSLCIAGLFCLWTKKFALVNCIVGLFNLLPIGNLDGGRLSKFIN